MSDLKSLNNVESVYPYYIYNNHPFGASNKILVKLNQPSDTIHLQNVASQKSLDIIKQLDFMPLWYVVTCNENTIESPVEMAAYLYETGLFTEVDPTFTGRFITPIFEANNTSPSPMTLEFCENYIYEEVVEPNQWNFFNNPDAELADINVCGAWEAGYLGQGVTVTVIDTGIWAGLNDLPVSINDVIDPGDAKVKLYWSKMGGSSYSWPNYWNGIEGDFNCDNNYVEYGNIIGDPNGQNVVAGVMKPGEQALVVFEWEVPNPDTFCGLFDYPNANDAIRDGFSFLARIITDDDPMFLNELQIDTDGDGNNDLGSVWINANNNNNIAWKNVQVMGTEPNPKPGAITIANLSNESKEYTLEFKLEDNIKGTAIFEEAEVNIQMDNDLYQDWANSGAVKTNFITTNQQFKVTEDDAIIDNISLEAGAIKILQISFNFLADELTDKQEFVYHFIQRDKVTEDIIGGKTFYIKKGEAIAFDANAGDDKEIDKNQSVTLSAESINEPATYNWYDPEGNLIYTGMDFTLSPELTKQYTLEVIKDADGVKDYDEVTVEVNPFVFGIMSPNPATNEVTISYIAEDASSAYFMFTEQTTGNAYNHIIDTQDGQNTIDVSTYSTGIYLISLVCDGNLIETQQLLIN